MFGFSFDRHHSIQPQNTQETTQPRNLYKVERQFLRHPTVPSVTMPKYNPIFNLALPSSLVSSSPSLFSA
jgi:hypothetical protein